MNFVCKILRSAVVSCSTVIPLGLSIKDVYTKSKKKLAAFPLVRKMPALLQHLSPLVHADIIREKFPNSAINNFQTQQFRDSLNGMKKNK